MFRDLTTLLHNPETFSFAIEALVQRFKPLQPVYVAGVEARGFIFGATVAYELGAGFLTIRKPGKLPANVDRVDYKLEYGMDALEIHADALESMPKIPLGPDSTEAPRVILIDDLLATGGTASAAISLLSKLGANVVGAGFVIELSYLGGRNKISSEMDVFSLLQY